MATVNSVSPKQQERIWREEEDVRTLARAEEIKADKKRMGAAQKRASLIAKQKQMEAQAVGAVASGRVAGKGSAINTKKGGGAGRAKKAVKRKGK